MDYLSMLYSCTRRMVESVNMGSQKMGFNSRLQWRIFSSGLPMPSLPTCDGITPSIRAGIRANVIAITANGLPPSTVCTSKVVVLLDNNIDATDDDIVELLQPSAFSQGEHNALACLWTPLVHPPPTASQQNRRLPVSWAPLPMA
jgi:hypothetical protein